MDEGERPLVVHTGEEFAASEAEKIAKVAAMQPAPPARPAPPLAPIVPDYRPKEPKRPLAQRILLRDGLKVEIAKAVLLIVYISIGTYMWNQLNTGPAGIVRVFSLFWMFVGFVLLGLTFAVQCVLMGIFAALKWPFWVNLLVTLGLGPLGAAGLFWLLLQLRS